jgi:hypothetical protein
MTSIYFNLQVALSPRLILQSPVVTVCTNRFHIPKPNNLPTEYIYVTMIPTTKLEYRPAQNEGLDFATKAAYVYCAVQTDHLNKI